MIFMAETDGAAAPKYPRASYKYLKPAQTCCTSTHGRAAHKTQLPSTSSDRTREPRRSDAHDLAELSQSDWIAAFAITHSVSPRSDMQVSGGMPLQL